MSGVRQKKVSGDQVPTAAQVALNPPIIQPQEVKDHVVWYTDNYNGDCVIFWGPDRCGYTTDLNKAGRYTKAEADKIEKMRGKERAVPLRVAEAASRTHVTADRLRDELEKLAS